VKIYKGNNSSAPLIGSYSGDSIPLSLTLNTKQAFVSFTSDIDSIKPGFFINYNAATPNYCTGYKTLIATSGNFTDGSGNKKYNSNTYCKWLISPNTPTGSITLHFNNFSTETNNDILRIRKTFPDTIVATFSGNTIPPNYTVNAEEIVVEWITDYQNEFDGWDISYTSSGVGINEIVGIGNVFIYPNPADKFLNILMNINENQNIHCEIYSIEGKLIYSENWYNLQGKTNEFIDLKNIQSGIYILQLSNDKKEVSRQKIILK
jgi:hypothetical protein